MINSNVIFYKNCMKLNFVCIYIYPASPLRWDETQGLFFMWGAHTHTYVPRKKIAQFPTTTVTLASILL